MEVVYLDGQGLEQRDVDLRGSSMRSQANLASIEAIACLAVTQAKTQRLMPGIGFLCVADPKRGGVMNCRMKKQAAQNKSVCPNSLTSFLGSSKV